MTTTVHGRARERAQIAAALDDVAAGRSRALLVEGPAGIGKSTLLDEAVERAHAIGARVLRARGYESEADIPYAGLLELLGPVMDRRARLPDGQRRALDAALAIEAAGAPGDRYAVPVSVLGLLGVLAEEGPLLVVVDDAHWLDPASRGAVLFAAQRLMAEGIGLLVAARDSDGVRVDPVGFDHLALGPLDRDSALALLDAADPLAPDVADRLVRISAGIPLALRELSRGLSASQRSGRAPLAEPPAPGQEVQAAFARQLSALPGATRRALCVAGAADGLPERRLHDALERVGLPGEVLAPAFAHEVLVERDGRIAFRHPLLAAAAYHAATSVERRAAHAALAAVATDVAHRAWHLSAAAVGPDDEAAEALHAAADDARGRGAHAEAARAFARAAELTPDGRQRLALELEAARDHAIAGHGERALALATAVETRAADTRLRFGAKQVRAHLQMRAGAPAESMAALEELA
ncbi:MAG TPA: AAA family ATPase, partial [Capillimicrobium sp.]|nr:AAA family ATPase [Capillimicrobium sp.]